ncbi:MAG: hypothetical protein ACJAQT_003660 [Akkermansiaceae bacterium]|jgi:hypothetical protein
MNMKQNLLIGGGTVFGALAAVVLMKNLPSDEQNSANNTADPKPKIESADSTGQAKDGTASSTRSGIKVDEILGQLAENAPEIDLQELEGRRGEFRDEMRERQMARLTDKMGKWSAALGLDKDQQGKLLDLADSQFDEMESMEQTVEGGDPAEISDTAKRAMAIMSGRALEESMVEMLSPDQKKKYEEFGNLQNQNRAEAGSLRQLATLQEDLMLTPEQRNDAYGIIYANQMEQAETNSDVSSMIKQFASQSGITIDPALQGMISSIANRGMEQLASGEQLEGEGMKELAENAINSSVAEQVDLMRPVLTAAQLELYRGQLEGRFSNLGNLIPRGLNGQ